MNIYPKWNVNIFAKNFRITQQNVPDMRMVVIVVVTLMMMAVLQKLVTMLQVDREMKVCSVLYIFCKIIYNLDFNHHYIFMFCINALCSV